MGPAGDVGGNLLVFCCCISLGLRARRAGISTRKESGRMVFTDVDYIIINNKCINFFKLKLPLSMSMLNRDALVKKRRYAKSWDMI